jgi:hypothetical protein
MCPRSPHRYTTAGSNMLATSRLYSSPWGLFLVSAGETGMRRGVLGDRFQDPLCAPPHFSQRNTG